MIPNYESARAVQNGQRAVRYPRVLLSMRWDCGHGHVHETHSGAEACIARVARAHLTDPFDRPAYLVHEAGVVEPDGSQACRRCGFALLDAAPVEADRRLWGFPLGRRIIQGPTCTFLVTADRALAPDERPCV